MFALAFGVRLAALVVLAPPMHEGTSVWDFGHEAACLGDALRRGDGFADPWGKGTGPSGWLTPPYPALLALLMDAFGGVTPATAFVLFTLQSLFSAWTALLVVRLGEALALPRAGWWGGIAFALYPPAIWNATGVVWDTTFVAWATTGALVLGLRPAAFATGRRAAAAGLAFGGLALLNPAPGALALPVLVHGLFELPRAARARAGVVFAIAALLVPLPWVARNALVLGTANLRPNFGVELRLGNNPESNGHPVPFKFHPSHVPEELALYRKLGEVLYAANCRERALAWIEAHPGAFLALSARRLAYFWVGDPPLTDPRRGPAKEAGAGGASGGGQGGEGGRISARTDPAAWLKFLSFAVLGLAGLAGVLLGVRTVRQRWTLLGALFLFSLPYTVTHVSERYRFPIDPLLALLAAAAVIAILERRSARASPA